MNPVLNTRAWSLRARLIAVVAVLLTIALTATGVLTVAALRNQLMSQVDAQLIEQAQKMQQRGYAVPGDGGPGRGGHNPTPYVLEFVSDSGVVGRPVDQGEELPHLPKVSSRSYPRAPFTASEHDTHWRVVAIGVDDQSYGDGVLFIGLPLKDTEVTVSSVIWRFAVLGVALIGLLVAVGYWAIGRAFRPLRQVEHVAEAFGDGDTTRRVDGLPTGTEVGRLGASVNLMLDQIDTTLAAREASEARMRRFVGDASHELRTPLSTLRGFAELYRMGAVRGEENIAHTFRRIEDESTRMSALVEDLLRLARLDEKRPLNLTSVDLLVLVADAETDATALAPDRQVRVTGLDGHGEPDAALVTGDEQQLRQVVTNLMANSIRHTPPGSPVELAVGSRDGEAVFQVIDHGDGVPPELAERIFERFFRADESRARGPAGRGGGSGLGLAIVSAIVAAHHGTARVRPTPGGGATFEVRLPNRRSAPRPDQALSENSQGQPRTPSVRTS